MRRIHRAPAALSAVLALLLASGCSLFDKDDGPKSKGTVDVTAEGGAFTVEGVTINVAPQTVQATTKLTVSPPTVQKGDIPRPLGTATSSNVQFDISLAGGAQPLEPLDVQIPLSGAFLPAGAKPENARIYTPSDAGDWRLVPSVVKNGALHAKLAHLSLKSISFASPGELWDSINPWKPQEVKNCNRELTTTATGKVKLGGDGWKNDTSSVLHPCLVEENGKAMLRVGNNTSLMWSVASNGPSVNAPDGSVEAGLVKLIVKAFEPNKKVKAYLAEGDATWTKIDKNALPVTLEFKADPNTFLAQTFWVGLNMAVGMFTGTNGDKTTAYIKGFLALADGADCLKNAAEAANGVLDAKKAADILLSTCSEIIAKSLGVDVKSAGSLDWVLGGIIAALDGIKDSLGLLGTAFQGIMQQVNGNVTVRVASVAPPCATRKDFRDATGYNWYVTNIFCDQGWAFANMEGDGGDRIEVVIELQKKEWTKVSSGTSKRFYELDSICRKDSMPQSIKDKICV